MTRRPSIEVCFTEKIETANFNGNVILMAIIETKLMVIYHYSSISKMMQYF